VSGFGRLFGRKRHGEGEPSSEEEQRQGRRRGRAVEEPEDPEAQRQRELEAEGIQLARERGLAEEADRRENERLAADREAREAALAKLTGWTDSHCHLQYSPDESDEAAVVDRAVEAGVRRMVCVGTDGPSSRRAIDVAMRHTRSGVLDVGVYATVGLHPHDARAGLDDMAALLGELQPGTPGAERVVAIGECGLDYHYDHSPRSVQRKVFAAQVSLANEHGLALVIHTREAFEDTLAILDAEGVPSRTIFHCFTGGPADAERCLAVGAYLSFSGIATFANAGDVREAARLCPPDRILVETDSPYLTPVPHRGRPNEPAYVPLVGEAIAAIRGVSEEEMAGLTWANATAAFGLGSD
jgi:TatD DNase family protein